LAVRSLRLAASSWQAAKAMPIGVEVWSNSSSDKIRANAPSELIEKIDRTIEKTMLHFPFYF
jgi:hypothetical protein